MCMVGKHFNNMLSQAQHICIFSFLKIVEGRDKFSPLSWVNVLLCIFKVLTYTQSNMITVVPLTYRHVTEGHDFATLLDFKHKLH